MIPQGHQVGDVTHERKDVDVFSLVMVVVLVSFMVVICLMVCWGVLHFFNRAREAQQLGAPAQVAGTMTRFPAPRLIEHTGNEWNKTRSQEEAELTTYGWVDRSAGIVRIPIAHAMELLVERGLPEVGAGQTRLQLMQARPQTNKQPNEPVTAPSPKETP